MRMTSTFAGLVVDIDFGDLRGVNVGAEGLALPGFRIERDGGGIERGAADGRLAGDHPSVIGDIGDVHAALRIALDLYAMIFRFELVRLYAQHGRGDVEHHQLHFFGGKPGGVAGDVSGAARDRAGIHGRGVGVGGNHVHVIGGDAQFLRGDLGQNGERALAGLDGAGQQRGGAVLIHLHDRRTWVSGYGEADGVPHAGHAASATFH